MKTNIFLLAVLVAASQLFAAKKADPPSVAVALKAASVSLPAPPALELDENCIAVWDFAAGSLVSNPGGFQLALRGESALVQAADAAALQVEFPADNRQAGGAACTKYYAELNPEGAFSVSLSFFPRSEYFDPLKGHTHYLLDNKYILNPSASQEGYHKGFALVLAANGNLVTPRAYFGFGTFSNSASGKRSAIELDRWHSLEMHFHGNGKVTFKLDGQEAGESQVNPGPITPSRNRFCIGDRVGSGYSPFGGYIAAVRMRKEKDSNYSFSASQWHRRGFVRLEEQPTLHTEFINLSKQELSNVVVKASIAGLPEVQTQALASVPLMGKAVQQWKLEPTLLPGEYQLEMRLFDAAEQLLHSEAVDFYMAAEPADILPLVMWGGGQADILKDIGFTHYISNLTPHRGELSDTALISGLERLDQALKRGMYVVDSVFGKYRFRTEKRFLRTGRDGQPYSNAGIEASNPAVRQEFQELMQSVGQAFGEHPAWNATMLNSEIRGSSRPSFGGPEPAAFKAYAGYDIPAEINGAYPPPYRSNPALPWDQVLPDDYPPLVFMRWFWKQGDGWNPLHSLLTETLHQYIKHPFWTYHDPAVRVPPIWGSGGNADVISQWTYTYPDPIKIGQATDELIAMSQGNPGQKVMSMTQAIWYRSATAPLTQEPKNEPAWFANEKKAAFISIAPDFLSEALWSKLSRRVDGVMYHGYGSLIETTSHSGYRYTNPESKEVLKRLSRELLKPLGPLLKRVPEHSPELGILQSFTSTLYARSHHSFGWSKAWTCELHLALQWAHFQPAIFYEEHLLRGDLDDQVRVLFLPGLEVLSESLLAALRRFQARGGILVGDEFSSPAVPLDLRLRSVKRDSNDPVGSKQQLQALGLEIRQALAPHYRSPMSASSPDLVLRRRGTGEADYLFVINDQRGFGDYIGQWGMVQEKGLPLSGSVSLQRRFKAAYDLVANRQVPLQDSAEGSHCAVDMPGGGGALLLFLQNPIAQLRLRVASRAKLGQALPISLEVLDARRRQIAALLPVQIRLFDAEQRELPGSGYYVAENGRLELQPVLALNQVPGRLRIEAKCLATGKETSCYVEVK